ncbi:MAG TPA: cyanophycin synthetase, partial [Haliscomenobacter sp.]|nr:cyanophycin synthetase [Haliscomenobacter sp.]
AIENYNPNMNRSQWVSWGTNSILLDAYNANPSSMEVALRTFSESTASQRIAILGDMFELGESSAVEHERIAQLAKSLNIAQVILVGHHFEAIARQLGWLHFPNVGALKPWFEAQQWGNTAFLIKGSRGMALEKLLG